MTSTAKRSTIDGIDVISITRKHVSRTVVMLHGFGASCEDLAPLAQVLDQNERWNWIFPNGIQQVPIGQHMTGRAWFPIRMADIEAAAMRGQVVDLADMLPQGMKDAESRLLSMIDTLRIPTHDLVLGGFSQGAMMSVQVCVNMPTTFAGLVLLSGTLINQKEWAEKLPSVNKTPVFQSHGKSDPVLGFHHAVKLNELLKVKGLKADFVEFAGGHEIPPVVIRKSAEFLSNMEKS